MDIRDNASDTINRSRIHVDNGQFSHSANSERIRDLDITLMEALFRSFCVVLASIGMLFNFFVLKSLVSVRSENLKSKLFILNMAFADFLLPLVSSFDIMLYILYGFGVTEDHVLSCVEVLNRTSAPVTLYYQCVSSLVLACDRLYAILGPLQYYTVGYHKWVLRCIIGGTWVIPLALILPVFILPFIKPLKVAGQGICYKLMGGHRAWTNLVRSNVLLGFGVITFFIYITLFILVKRIRRKNVAVTEAQSSNRKTSLSLTITYFMVHCASLACFLPSPIYSELIRRKVVQVSEFANIAIRRILLLLYLLNPVLDPVVLSLRIPAIKGQLNIMLGFNRISHHRSKGAQSGFTGADIT